MEYNLNDLISMRCGIRDSTRTSMQKPSPKEEEIIAKLDELILTELNKLTPQETE